MRAASFFLLVLPLFGQEYTIKALSRHPLTNESIITLARAGFDEGFIAERILNSRTSFTTEVDDLVALKKAGISEELIRIMLQPSLAATLIQPPHSPAATTTPQAEPAKSAEAKSCEKAWWKFSWVPGRRSTCQ